MDDLKLIKKYYGEEMMHFARDNFSTILEEKGKLIQIFENMFPHNKYLYENLSKPVSCLYSFSEYINNSYNSINTDKNNQIKESPKDLLDKAGYILYECHNERDIQKFKKYYQSNEKLCTFNGGRLNHCFVFFAVKKDVDSIKRTDNPKRDDLYGTSVISIQFTRGKTNILSIKNRYNHTVENPDATFHNNLENIIPGLTKAFEECYGFNIHQNSIIMNFPDNFILADDNKYYRSNVECNNIHFCSDNYIIDNGILNDKYHKEKERYIVVDNYIIDLKEKKVKNFFTRSHYYIKTPNVINEFIYSLSPIKDIKVINEKKEKIKTINFYLENNCSVTIKINKFNEMIYYENNFVEEIENNFLPSNKSLETIIMPNLKVVGDDFLYFNQNIKSLFLPKLKKIGDAFLYHNRNLKEIKLPNVEVIANSFLGKNLSLENINFPNLNIVGRCFLGENVILKDIKAPNLEIVDDFFLESNLSLNEIDLPNLRETGEDFLYFNENISQINLPKLEKAGNRFMRKNIKCEKIFLPSLIIAPYAHFFQFNTNAKEIDLPLLDGLPYYSFDNIKLSSKVNLPNIKYKDKIKINLNKINFIYKLAMKFR